MPKRYNGGSTFSLSYTTGGQDPQTVSFTFDTVSSYDPQWDWENEDFEAWDFSKVEVTGGRRFSCSITTGLLDSTDLAALKAVLAKRALTFTCPDYPNGIAVYVQSVSQPMAVSNIYGTYSRITITLAAVSVDGGSASSPLIEYSNDGLTWTAFRNCGNAKYSKAIAGIGLGGIATASLTFDTAEDNEPGTAAAVRISGVNTVFYINSRSYNYKIISYECVDATAFLDQEIDLESSEASIYVDPNTGEKFLTYTAFEDMIAYNCKGIDVTVGTLDARGIPIDLVKGKTYQQFLTDLSIAKGGFYSLSSSILRLITPQTPQGGDQPMNGEFAYVNIGAAFTPNAVLVEDDPQYTIPSGSAIQYNTLTAGGSCIRYADTAALAKYPSNDCFRDWQCSSVHLSSEPSLGGYMDFRPFTNTLLRLTSVNIRWVGQQMVGSLAGTIPESGEINRQPRYLSDIEEKIEENKVYGENMMITPYQGIVYLEEDAQEEGGQS